MRLPCMLQTGGRFGIKWGIRAGLHGRSPEPEGQRSRYSEEVPADSAGLCFPPTRSAGTKESSSNKSFKHCTKASSRPPRRSCSSEERRLNCLILNNGRCGLQRNEVRKKTGASSRLVSKCQRQARCIQGRMQQPKKGLGECRTDAQGALRLTTCSNSFPSRQMRDETSEAHHVTVSSWRTGGAIEDQQCP